MCQILTIYHITVSCKQFEIHTGVNTVQSVQHIAICVEACELNLVCLSRVTHLDCACVSSQRRLTALGCQNGFVVVAVVDVITKGS